MLIFREFFNTQSDQNPKRTKLHQIFKIFSWQQYHMPLNSPASRAIKINMLHEF